MTFSDLRFAIRRLHRHRSVSLAAILTLALGIGAVTALFSVVRTVLLRPPPFRAPDQLVGVDLHPRGQPGGRLEISYPDFRDWRARLRAFQDLAAHQTAIGRVVWESGGEPVPTVDSWCPATSSIFSGCGPRWAARSSLPTTGREPSRHWS
jgi:hypothetical protein